MHNYIFYYSMVVIAAGCGLIGFSATSVPLGCGIFVVASQFFYVLSEIAKRKSNDR